MIPYFRLPPLRVLGQPIEPFTWFVAAGILVCFLLMQRRVRAVGLHEPTSAAGFLWLAVGGLFGAHALEVLAYYPERLWERGPLTLLALWEGLSSFGGFIGGALGLYLFCRRYGVWMLVYGDALMFGLAPGWAVARAGCFVSHDHPGVASSFVLAVAYPDGPRHNLGFYEMLWSLVIAAVLHLLPRRRRFVGFYTALVLCLYAPARFLLDFLRTADRRYLGLTAAQYLCWVMVAIAAVLIVRGRERGTNERGTNEA
jgi:phosphatidylglycerol:prolipoprotein diacylglycerol transferase